MVLKSCVLRPPSQAGTERFFAAPIKRQSSCECTCLNHNDETASGSGQNAECRTVDRASGRDVNSRARSESSVNRRQETHAVIQLSRPHAANACHRSRPAQEPNIRHHRLFLLMDPKISRLSIGPLGTQMTQLGLPFSLILCCSQNICSEKTVKPKTP